MLKQLITVTFLMVLIHSNVQAFTFKIATLSSEGSVWMENMRAGAKEIEKRTDSRVKFKFYPGGVMGGDKNVLRKMRFNQLHGTALSGAGLSDIYPEIQLYNLVLKFKSFQEVDYVRQRMDEELIAGLEKKGMISFGLAEMGFAYIMSTTAIANVAELRQQKVWVPDSNKIAIAAFKAASVSPIPLPLRDVLMGLQTGMINTVAGTATGALALQWHTKIKYVAELPLSYVFGTLVLNQKAFNKISINDQKIVREEMAKVAHKVDQQSRQDNISAGNALKNQGIQFIKVETAAANELKNIMEVANKNIEASNGMSEQLLRQLNNNLIEFESGNSQ